MIGYGQLAYCYIYRYFGLFYDYYSRIFCIGQQFTVWLFTPIVEKLNTAIYFVFIDLSVIEIERIHNPKMNPSSVSNGLQV